MFGVISSQFIGQNIHFAVGLFAALACFVAGWLYFDAWSDRRKFLELAKWTGFFLLAIAYLLGGATWGKPGLLSMIAVGLKLLGYAGILWGNILDPIQPRPKNLGLTGEMEPPKHPAPAPPPLQPRPAPKLPTPTAPAKSASSTPPPSPADVAGSATKSVVPGISAPTSSAVAPISATSARAASMPATTSGSTNQAAPGGIKPAVTATAVEASQLTSGRVPNSSSTMSPKPASDPNSSAAAGTSHVLFNPAGSAVPTNTHSLAPRPIAQTAPQRAAGDSPQPRAQTGPSVPVTSGPTAPPPAPATPAHQDQRPTQSGAPAMAGLSLASGATWGVTAAPIAALAIASLYWRRATTGLERHIKPLAGAFLIFTIGDALSWAQVWWRDTDNPLLQPIVAPAGPIWIAEQVVVVAGAALLMWWVWRYLTKRLLSQLFLMATSFTVVIVLVATVGISALLLSSLQGDSLKSLETAGKVLGYTIDSKTAETRASSEVAAQNPATAQAIAARNHTGLAQIASELLVRKRLTDVIITGDAGQVLVRGSDPERSGDSISDDSLVKRALTGASASTIAPRAGVLAPTLLITTATPIRSQGTQGPIVGVALASLALDNAFVDGIKHTTGLDSTIFSGNVRAATTLTAPDGTSRQVGAKETNAGVLKQTLQQGKSWLGAMNVANRSYLAVFLPLKDVDNTVVGMLFIGQVQETLLQTADQAIKLTFAWAALILLVLIIPIYLTARQIVQQLH